MARSLHDGLEDVDAVCGRRHVGEERREAASRPPRCPRARRQPGHREDGGCRDLGGAISTTRQEPGTRNWFVHHYWTSYDATT